MSLKKATPALLTFLLLIASGNLTAHVNDKAWQQAIISAALHQRDADDDALTTLDNAHVTLVVFTSYAGYKLNDSQLNATVWTTVAPEMQKQCAQYVRQKHGTVTTKELTAWIARFLGLPDREADKRRFVALSVPVIQAYYGESFSNIGIFRPCTDPRITPHEDHSPICPDEMDSHNHDITSVYKTWFINNSIAAHRLDHGSPWTEYGYTYNWNNDTSSTQGVAEFVVLKGTPVTVLPNPLDAHSAYISAEQYCQT
ncbi:MAG: hypothetical protein A3E85_00985 [Gammaproteobacteria bacterium RIFCSPHIGHO2_12_FULL_45_12]|nr:MAG: hypothetical protein A3E85_00985 [Gammaproteobacteria bacterium RIFCSPHIGHO2_12_FULL_45_12]